MSDLNPKERQTCVADWVRRCFGESKMQPRERVLRFLEEALELVQSEGVSSEEVHQMLEYVFTRAPGDPVQELGGVRLTLLAYAEAKGFSAEEAELTELKRILSKNPEYFRQRSLGKISADTSGPELDPP